MAVTSNLGRVVGATIIVKASQPTVRDDNSKLLEGDIWINSTTQQLYKYQGGVFIDTGINIKGEKGDAGSDADLSEEMASIQQQISSSISSLHEQIQTETDDKFVPKTTQISTGDVQANIVNDNATLHIERVTPRSGAVSRIRWSDTSVEIYAKGTTGSDATYKFDYLGNLTKTIGDTTDSYITIDQLENYLVATDEEVKAALGIS